MSSMHQVELTPLGGGERTKDGMVGQRLAAAEAGFTFVNDAVHAGSILKDFCLYLFSRSATR